MNMNTQSPSETYLNAFWDALCASERMRLSSQMFWLELALPFAQLFSPPSRAALAIDTVQSSSFGQHQVIHATFGQRASR
jgi:hypothetical protein